MRIDMKREAEANQRKGLTWRTLLSLIWFVICLILAYFVTGWLVSSGTLDSAFVHGTLSLPPTVNVQIVRVASMLLMVGALQFLVVVIFAMTNPAAKTRTGRPTATAQSYDYYEQQYNRRG